MDTVDTPATTGRSILVTGATAPAGLRLVDRLLVNPAVDRVLATGVEPPEATVLASREGVIYRQVDLTRRRRVWRFLFGEAKALEVDTVVHMATHRSTRATGQRAHRLNVDATRTLVDLCERHATVRRFVYRSYAEVYALDAAAPDIIDERQPLHLSTEAPQWLRDRVEADLLVCTRMGLAPDLKIAVLRCADCLAPGIGSQLHDYLGSRVCFRPLGYDPMLNVLSVDDLVEALARAVLSSEPVEGVFNIPGLDTLPLSALLRATERVEIAVPAAALWPLYALRSVARGTEFDYRMNRWRLHYNGVLDGGRAARELGWTPAVPAL